ncbi:MAG: hypothetical protein LBR55_02435 [Bacteroidales bacterium]|jgi:hypothetical protein|nr:hypothetical protein [Bacteroidales bacterium]
MKEQVFIYLIVLMGLLGCQRNERKLADELLKRIEYSFEHKKYNTAKLQIDSLNLLYRHRVELRRVADNYLYKIEQAEVERNLAYFSEQIPKKKLKLDSMSHYFTLEKNELVQDLGGYVYKGTRRNSNQTFLKAQVDESGQIFLTSVYYDGSACSSQSVKLQSGDYFVLSSMVEPDDEIYGYSFSGEKSNWRILPLSEKESEKLAHFVSVYYNDDILVSLAGNDCHSNYILDEGQKEAIRESYYLSLILKEIKELKSNTENSKKQLALIKQKITG